MRQVYVLDVSAFLSGYPLEEGEFYTVSEVLKELHESKARLRAELSIEGGSLRVVTPPGSGKLEEAAMDTGDIAALSKADLSLLSLALHLREEGLEPVIVTDDYSMQNVAKKLKLSYLPAAEMGIKKLMKWRMVCRGCGRVYAASYKGRCRLCGSEVRKRRMNIYRGA
jgi:UPF0271 protein